MLRACGRALCWRCTARAELDDGAYLDVTRGGDHVSAWREKWGRILDTMRVARHSDRRDEGPDVESTRYVFSLMLRLYAHKPVLHELEALYSFQPERFILYVPQFAAFALHGAAAETLGALEQFLLDKSALSLRFAQQLWWFVRSFAPAECQGPLARGTEERAAAACKALRQEARCTAARAQRNIEHLDFQPTMPLPRLAAGPPHVLGVSDFQWSISFWDELTNMGIELKGAEEAHRNRVLRATLDQLVDDYMPSDVMYLPVGDRSARVVNVVSDESFCFKTNTRVPFLVCLEVLDDAMPAQPEAAAVAVERTPSRVSGALSEWRFQLRRQFSASSNSLALSDSGSMVSLDQGIALRPLATGQRPLTGREDRLSSSDALMQTPPSPEGAATAAAAAAADGKETAEGLGQWTPKLAAPKGRGAGFSHFANHKDFDFEHLRDAARLKALRQHYSTGVAFTEVDLDGDSVASSVHSRREAVVPTADSSDDDSSFAAEDLHAADERMRVAPQQLQRGLQQRQGSSRDMTGLSEVHERQGEVEAGAAEAGEAGEAGEEEEEEEEDAVERGDREKGVIFRERWAAKERRVAARSAFSHLPGWRLVPVIVKSGDDLRQEQFAAQLIRLFDTVFREEGLPLYLHPYDVLAVSPDSGLIQAVPDTISLDSLKKNDPLYTNLRDFFVRFHGRPKTAAFLCARENFCRSLASYCIVSYLLQIKDRHNGNLLLDAEGHIIHIDFGFLLSSQGPGNMNFERYPFKLTNEFVQLLDGPESATFRRFRWLCCKAYLAARRRREQFVLMIEMMLCGEGCGLPCFQAGGEETIRQLNERFCVGKSRSHCVSFVNDLIDTSVGHWRSKWYDIYQRWTVGIAV